jgi:ABC-type branched-subunit amino acid transport system substrate-binding protein
MLGLLQSYGWTEVAIIRAADMYSRSVFNAVIRMNEETKVPDIRVQCDIDYVVGTPEFDAVVQACLGEIIASGVKVVLVAGQAPDTTEILFHALEMGIMGPGVDTQWLVSETMVVKGSALRNTLADRGYATGALEGLMATAYGVNNASAVNNHAKLLFDFYQENFPGTTSIEPLYAAYAFDSVLAVAHGNFALTPSLNLVALSPAISSLFSLCIIYYHPSPRPPSSTPFSCPRRCQKAPPRPHR